MEKKKPQLEDLLSKVTPENKHKDLFDRVSYGTNEHFIKEMLQFAKEHGVTDEEFINGLKELIYKYSGILKNFSKK
jgi:hypothetical protein